MTAGRKVWNIIFPILLYLIITMVINTVLQIVFMYLMGFNMLDAALFVERMPHAMLIITLISYAVVFIVMIFLYRKDHLMAGEDRPLSVSGVILTLLICAAVSFAVQYLIALSGIDRIFTGYDEVYSNLFAGQPVILLAVTVGLIGPAAEELVFRGLVLARLERYTNTKIAVIVSALVFGFIHMNVVQFIYASVMGLLFGFFYIKYRNIKIPILAHITVNMLGVIAAAVS